MAEELRPPVRPVNFVSEEELAAVKKTRGERVDDGTAQRDRSLYEVLKENKDKRDAEFNERFKHRPPKALDEDETEFLDKLTMSRREYERQLEDEEAQQLQNFKAAVAAQASIVRELKEPLHIPAIQEQKAVGKKNSHARSVDMIIKVRPQGPKPKKTKLDRHDETASGGDTNRHGVTMAGLVSYSDDEDD